MMNADAPVDETGEFAQDLVVEWSDSHAWSRIYRGLEAAKEDGASGDKSAAALGRGFEAMTRRDTTVVIRTAAEAACVLNDLEMWIDAPSTHDSAATVNSWKRVRDAIDAGLQNRGLERDDLPDAYGRDEDDDEDTLVTDGGRDDPGDDETPLEEPIKIRWTGDARTKFVTRELEPRAGTDGMRESARRAGRTIQREKTNVVIETVEEAEAFRECIESFHKHVTPADDGWRTAAHIRAVRRVLGETREQIDARTVEMYDDELRADGGEPIDGYDREYVTLPPVREGDRVRVTYTSEQTGEEMTRVGTVVKVHVNGFHLDCGREGYRTSVRQHDEIVGSKKGETYTSVSTLSEHSPGQYGHAAHLAKSFERHGVEVLERDD